MQRQHLYTTSVSSCCHSCIDQRRSMNENSSIQSVQSVWKHFTYLSWLILICFLRWFSVTFLLCWTATAGSDSRYGAEGRDDMQQRSRSEDVSRTSTNCQGGSFMPKLRHSALLFPLKLYILFDLHFPSGWACLRAQPVIFFHSVWGWCRDIQREKLQLWSLMLRSYVVKLYLLLMFIINRDTLRNKGPHVQISTHTYN